MLQGEMQKTILFHRNHSPAATEARKLLTHPSWSPSALASLHVLHHTLCLPFSTEWGTPPPTCAVPKSVEGKTTKPNLLLAQPKLRWSISGSCLHSAWWHCQNHKWKINSYTFDSVEVEYQSQAGSQQRGKFQPAKFMAQQAVEALVSSYAIPLSSHTFITLNICGSVEVQGASRLLSMLDSIFSLNVCKCYFYLHLCRAVICNTKA